MNYRNDDLVKVNIGASKTRIPGFINIDIVEWADISINLNQNPLPFDDNSVDLIFIYHTLEHFDNLFNILYEIHRVLKHNSWLLVGVPYVTLTEYNLVNPYHKHHFNEYSFDFFDPERLLGSASEETPIRFRKVYHEFHYLPEFATVPEPMRTWCRRHMFNVVQKIDFGLLALKGGLAAADEGENLEKKMRTEFSICLSSRESYPRSKS